MCPAVHKVLVYACLMVPCAVMAATKKSCANTKTMVVFVHGTLMPHFENPTAFSLLHSASNLFFKALQHVVTKPINELPAKIHGALTRYWIDSRDKTFHVQSLQSLGLHKVVLQDDNKKNVTAFIARSFDEQYKDSKGSFDSSAAPHTFGPDCLSYYTFGWSGVLSHLGRQEAAREFYTALLSERDRLRDAGANQVKILILAHSHGGNVTLLLADQENQLHRGLQINKIVLLGTPVQQETDSLVHDPMFEKVYSITSYGDAIQPVDYFSTSGRSCKQIFSAQQKKHLPLRTNKLIQIRVSLRLEDEGEVHPTHNELWNCADFDADPLNEPYRSFFPLHPLPLVVVVPCIIRLVHECLGFRDYVHLLIGIEPLKGSMMLYDYRSSCQAPEVLRENPSQQIAPTMSFALPAERVLPWIGLLE